MVAGLFLCDSEKRIKRFVVPIALRKAHLKHPTPSYCQGVTLHCEVRRDAEMEQHVGFCCNLMEKCSLDVFLLDVFTTDAFCEILSAN